MGEWSLWGQGIVEAAGVDTTTTGMKRMTAAASANAKGNYVELIASTPFPSRWAQVHFDILTAAPNDGLIDLAIGAAASEQVIASNLISSGSSTSLIATALYLLPLNIPAGVRLTARFQSSLANAIRDVSIHLCGGGFTLPPGLGRLTTYGANTGDSGGVSVDPGGVAHTKGSYSEIVAATTNPIRWLLVGMGNQINGARTSGSILLDIAIGAGGSEQIILPNLFILCDGVADTIFPQVFGPFPVSIPSGTRIAARSQASITDAADRLVDVIIYGMD